MRLEIGSDRLAELFPAYILVDCTGSILACGPSLARQMPQLTAGSLLTDHFSCGGAADCASFPELSRAGTRLELRSHDARIFLTGSLLDTAPNYLLAVRHLPPRFSLKANDLQMSDFGPDDPTVAGMLLVGLQQAMLEDSLEIARELGRERQRSAELFHHFSRVAGYMAHDFNNLLSIIQLNSNRIAGEATSTAQTKRLAKMICETTERGSEISHSLMTLSHQRQDARTILEPDKIVINNLQFFKTIVGPRVKIELSLNAAGRLVEVSRIGLINSLINLIVNARDAMPDGGSILISTDVRSNTERSASEHGGAADTIVSCNQIVIVVSDSGSGMSDEVLANAFKPLFSSKTGGNGLGLSSVLEFAREMGGDARLDSSPGVGTSCSIFLPLSDAASETPKVETNGLGVASKKNGRKPARIVLVEDEPYALEALTELLAAQGVEVAPCSTAEEARAAIAAGGCQILLSDVVLADESGVALARHACEFVPNVSVILMSGYVPSSETLDESWQFIRKPLDSEILSNMVAAALTSFSKGPNVT